MKEIINSILEAEEKAKQIVDMASVKANAVLLDADKKAELIREDAVVSFKEERKNKLDLANKEADRLYEACIKDSEKDAKEIIKLASDKTDKCVDLIIKELVK